MNYKNEQLYLATMYLAHQMLEQGIITQEDYAKIDTIFAEKYGATFGRLFTDLSLI